MEDAVWIRWQKLGFVSTSQEARKIGSKPPEARRGTRNNLSLMTLGRNQLCQHFDVELLAWRTVRQYISEWVKKSSLWCFVMAPPGYFSIFQPGQLYFIVRNRIRTRFVLIMWHYNGSSFFSLFYTPVRSETIAFNSEFVLCYSCLWYLKLRKDRLIISDANTDSYFKHY